jgi:2-methylcitrate dehydratase PrpD
MQLATKPKTQGRRVCITSLREFLMNTARQLAQFAQSTFVQDIIPLSVKEIAILALIDQFGLQVAGTHFAWSKSIYQYLVKYNQPSGQSTITDYELLTSPVQAAFINGCFAYAQDFDDSHQAAQTHPGSVVIPAAIAIGQHLNQNGATVLTAIIIGMECMLRLAHSLCPACIEGGHHTPLTLGPFGAAIAAGLLLDLNEDEMVDASVLLGFSANH